MRHNRLIINCDNSSCVLKIKANSASYWLLFFLTSTIIRMGLENCQVQRCLFISTHKTFPLYLYLLYEYREVSYQQIPSIDRISYQFNIFPLKYTRYIILYQYLNGYTTSKLVYNLP